MMENNQLNDLMLRKAEIVKALKNNKRTSIIAKEFNTTMSFVSQIKKELLDFNIERERYQVFLNHVKTLIPVINSWEKTILKNWESELNKKLKIFGDIN